jgi:hypothetical protein
MWIAGLAPQIISAVAHRSDGGMTMPPSSTGTSRLPHSASTYARKDLRKDSGIVTEWVAGS